MWEDRVTVCVLIFFCFQVGGSPSASTIPCPGGDEEVECSDDSPLAGKSVKSCTPVTPKKPKEPKYPKTPKNSPSPKLPKSLKSKRVKFSTIKVKAPKAKSPKTKLQQINLSAAETEIPAITQVGVTTAGAVIAAIAVGYVLLLIMRRRRIEADAQYVDRVLGNMKESEMDTASSISGSQASALSLSWDNSIAVVDKTRDLDESAHFMTPKKVSGFKAGKTYVVRILKAYFFAI